MLAHPRVLARGAHAGGGTAATNAAAVTTAVATAAHLATAVTTACTAACTAAPAAPAGCPALSNRPAAILCQSVHIVCTPADGYEVLTCDGNPCKYECLACKTFKGVGICSHVLAINHILQKFNLRYELKQLQTRASKKQAAKAGKVVRPLPALQRAPVAQPDSSDE